MIVETVVMHEVSSSDYSSDCTLFRELTGTRVCRARPTSRLGCRLRIGLEAQSECSIYKLSAAYSNDV
jgi:hypothetical protein